MAPAQRFSHSRLTMLSDCPKRYFFRYVQGLREAFQGIEAFMGSLVHEAIQWAYLEREARREPAADAVVARFRAAWVERMGSHVKVVQEGREAGEWLEQGDQILRQHLAGTFAADRMETLAVEPKIDLVLGGHSYTGFIDRLARDKDGKLHVIDYKTSRSMPPDVRQAGLQARGYGLAVLEEHGGLEVGVRYEYLRHGRILEETLTRAQSADVASALSAKIDEALAAERAGVFPARPGPLCRWCGFRETCDASPFFAAALSTPSVPATARSATTAEACPRCGSPMQRRTGSRGDIIACSRYPECPQARNA